MEYNGEWLYRRTTSGNVQTWRAKSHSLSTESKIVIEFGLMKGTHQTTIKTITEGKQKRSISEQAVFMSKALYKEKKDEGYKSFSDLDTSKLIFPLQSSEQFEKWLLTALPIHDTDINGNLRPMLAHPVIKMVKGVAVDHWNKVSFPCIGEDKLDGVRCNIMDGTDDNTMFSIPVKSLSREGSSYDFGTHKIRQALVPLFKKYPHIILDGELYKHDIPQAHISGAMRSNGGGDYKYVFSLMEFHVYDIIDTSLTLKERKEILCQLQDEFPNSFVLHPFTVLNSREEVDIKEQEAIDKRFEGYMLKDINGMYMPGKRSWGFIKVKRFQDAEFKITGFLLGERGVRDLILTFEHPNPEREDFKAVAIGSVADKEKLHKELLSGMLIGELATIKFKDYTEYGTPNHGHVKAVRGRNE